jgi:hypothetical protein
MQPICLILYPQPSLHSSVCCVLLFARAWLVRVYESAHRQSGTGSGRNIIYTPLLRTPPSTQPHVRTRPHDPSTRHVDGALSPGCGFIFPIPLTHTHRYSRCVRRRASKSVEKRRCDAVIENRREMHTIRTVSLACMHNKSATMDASSAAAAAGRYVKGSTSCCRKYA